MRMNWSLVVVAGLWLWACGDPGGPDPGVTSTGTLVVSTSTEGDDPDQDGYLLTVDGADSLALHPTGTVQVDLAPGRHNLRLLGVAEHCTVAQGVSLQVDVPLRDTTAVAFGITCSVIAPSPTSGARITVTTTGVDIDPDGYRIAVDGGDRGPISTNGTMLIRLDPGSRTLALTGLTPNCAVDGSGSRTVIIVSSEVMPIDFAVVCTATTPQPPPTSGVLAFTTLDNNLALVNLDGTHYRPLTTASSNQSDIGAVWSPSGDRIAFSRMTDAAPFPLAIHVINPDGTNLIRLSPQGALDDSPTWSPDGRRIAFANQDPRVHTAASAQIYLMDVDGSHRVPLTSLPRGAFSPTWSPDGEKIAFGDRGIGGYLGNIYVMDADGTHLSALTNDRARNSNPAWSPDGTRIVFSRGRALFTINADGTHRTRLTSPPATRWSYSDYEPAWSPDGRAVVFTRSYDCDPLNDNEGPSCVPNELRTIQLAGAAFVSSLVTHGSKASWGP
jgi:dipeptidyl aminopeptidase/acylaminoacyl peptidase